MHTHSPCQHGKLGLPPQPADTATRATTRLPATRRATYTLLALFIGLPMLNACENKGTADLANVPLDQAAPEVVHDDAIPDPQSVTPQSESVDPTLATPPATTVPAVPATPETPAPASTKDHLPKP